MNGTRGKLVVLLVSLAAAAGWVLAQRLRSFAAGEGRLDDGSQRRVALDSPGLRHVVWDRAQPLGGASASAGGEERPALSEDGRWLVFAAGERGLNCELYLAELVGAVPGEPRRIAALDGPADELAPSFCGAWLYFASDRAGGAGGLDLYRARFVDGSFDAPERLDAALQSADDDADPALDERGGRLVFASTREGAWHLFEAHLDGAGAPLAGPTRLAQLESGEAEREPCFTPDGRALCFAVQRAGRFDLARSEFARGAWQAPHALELPEEDAERRGPAFAAHGFELWFARTRAGEAPHLARAASLELVAVPPLAWTLFDSLVVGSLLVLALAALLALRWRGLALAYKCVLASVLVHLVLLFLLRFVIVGGGAGESGSGAPAAPEAAPDFQLLPTLHVAPVAGRERAGALEESAGETAQPGPVRAERSRGASEAAAPAPALASLAQAPDGGGESAPERAQPDPAPRANPVVTSVALEAPREAHSRRGARSPDLALEANAATSRRANADEASSAGVSRARFIEHESSPAPVTGALSARELPHVAADGASDTPARARSTSVPSASPLAGRVELAAPREEPAERRASAAAPGLALEGAGLEGAQLQAANPSALAGGPVRAPRAAAPGGMTAPSAPAGASDLVAAPADGPAAPGRGAAELGPPAAGSDASAARELVLAGPREERAGRPSSAAGSAPALELGEPDASGSAPAASAVGGGPARATLAPRESGPVGPGGAGAALVRADPSSGASVDGAPARRGDLAPPRAAGGAPRVALADREGPSTPRKLDGAQGKEGSGRGAADLLAGLGQQHGDASAETAQPRAASFDAPRERARAGTQTEPPLVRMPELARDEVRVERRSWEHTPYENRSGEEKARALKLHGGDARTEEAVARGLDYLARIQQRDGHWGALENFDAKYGQVAVGKSGLVLLAFLGAGHTQLSNTRHSAVVARAVEALLALQDEESAHFGRCDAYGHGIATYALAEDLAMTGDARVRAALERAVRHILAEQNTQSDPRLSGGWSYYFPDGHVFDGWPRTAISAWQVMALESARLSGIRVSDQAFEAAKRFLLAARDEELGGWRYDHDPARLASDFATLPASTPAAMFALSLLGEDLAGADYAAARAYVLARAPGGYRFSSEEDFVRRGTGNLYFWYYGTLALFRAGGPDWQRWNESMKRTLLPAQNADGSWEPIDPYARFARDTAQDKSYTSALCVLSLEIYYRYYLPLLKVR